MPTTPPPTSRGQFPAPRAERTPAFLEHDRAAARTEWKDAATLLASIRRPRRSRFAPPSITSVRKISISSLYPPLLVSDRGTPGNRLRRSPKTSCSMRGAKKSSRSAVALRKSRVTQPRYCDCELRSRRHAARQSLSRNAVLVMRLRAPRPEPLAYAANSPSHPRPAAGPNNCAMAICDSTSGSAQLRRS